MDKLISGAIAAFGAAAFGAGASAVISEKCLKTSVYELDTGKCAMPFNIVAVSDLHFSTFGKNDSRLVEAVKKAGPDVIFCTGDFFDFRNGKDNWKQAFSLLSALSGITDVYFSSGNHDMRYDVRTGKSHRDYVEGAGCRYLDGEYADVSIKGNDVRIGGIFDYGTFEEDYGPRWPGSEVYSFLRSFDETDSLKLLLMHRPNTFIYTDPAEDGWQADAVFSGHDHGGLWRLPLVGGVYAPEQGFFPEYTRGVYEFGRMKMVLSAGLEGYYFVPRLFNRAEIVKCVIS